MFRVHLGGNAVNVVTHPDVVQQVLLSRRDNYIKGPAYDPVRKLIGDGLLTLEGDAWKGRHALAQPVFHRRSIEKLTVTMVESGARYFDRQVELQGTAEQELNIHQLFVGLTLDVVIAALFGAGALASDQVSYTALSSALELLSDGINGFRLPDWLPSPRNVKFRRTTRELDRNVFTIIDHARKSQERGGSGTLLSMLLDARDEAGAQLSTEELRTEVLTLFLAGHETTALTLTWLFALLDERPDVVARMRDEVDSVLAGRDPGFDDVARLPYLRQVVDETLRVRPVAPVVARNVVEDDELGGYAVGRGEMVMPYIWGIHRHPEFWTRPERFDPDRFDIGGAARPKHKWSYLPFSGGPRVCIGSAFSLVESVVLLAQLINRFDFRVQSCADVKPNAIGTVRPSRPIRVRLKVRPGRRRPSGGRAA